MPAGAPPSPPRDTARPAHPSPPECRLPERKAKRQHTKAGKAGSPRGGRQRAKASEAGSTPSPNRQRFGSPQPGAKRQARSTTSPPGTGREIHNCPQKRVLPESRAPTYEDAPQTPRPQPRNLNPGSTFHTNKACPATHPASQNLALCRTHTPALQPTCRPSSAARPQTRRQNNAVASRHRGANRPPTGWERCGAGDDPADRVSDDLAESMKFTSPRPAELSSRRRPPAPGIQPTHDHRQNRVVNVGLWTTLVAGGSR